MIEARALLDAIADVLFPKNMSRIEIIGQLRRDDSDLTTTILRRWQALGPEYEKLFPATIVSQEDRQWMHGWNEFCSFKGMSDRSDPNEKLGYANAFDWMFRGNGQPTAFLIQKPPEIYCAGWQVGDTVAFPSLVEGNYSTDGATRLYHGGQRCRQQYDYFRGNKGNAR